VQFRPSAAGARSATLVVTSNAPGSPNAIPLSGTGILATLALTPPHAATLSWQASTSIVTGYYVYRSTVNGSAYSRLNSTPTAANSYLDSSVLAGQTYYYVVTSVDWNGMESGFSTSVAAVIPTP
jgi:fibronectin type 3 domain-containing protein